MPHTKFHINNKCLFSTRTLPIAYSRQGFARNGPGPMAWQCAGYIQTNPRKSEKKKKNYLALLPKTTQIQGFQTISLADSADSLLNNWVCTCQKWFLSRGDPIQATTMFLSDFWANYVFYKTQKTGVAQKQLFSCTCLPKCQGQIEAMGHRIISCVCQQIGFDR